MRGERGALNGIVAEVDLNLAQVHARFQKVRGIRVSQGVNGCFFADAAVFESSAESCLNIGMVSRFGSIVFMDAAASGGRKELDRVTMGFPRLSEQFQRALRQGHIPVFAAFAETHVHEHTRAVDIGNLQMNTFFQTQATGVHGR